MPNAGNERCVGAQDRQETRNDDGLAAVTGKKAIGLINVFAFEKARILVDEKPFAKILPDLKIDVIAEKRRDEQHDDQLVDIHAAQRRDGAGHEQ